MKHETTKALFEYWDGVRGTRLAPRRLEIEPAAIAALLPNLFILERLDQTSYRFRLAGTQLCSYCGHELRGRQFTSLWPEETREAVESLLFSVTEDAAGVVAGLEGKEPQGRTAAFELLLLPLTTAQGTFDRIIGAISPLEMPYWLGGWPVVAWSLKSTRILWPGGQPPAITESDTVHRLHPPASPRAHLTVIEGGLTDRTD